MVPSATSARRAISDTRAPWYPLRAKTLAADCRIRCRLSSLLRLAID
jgi:hypothetical protein